MHTPPGRGGIAVIVLRGPQAPQIAARAFRPLGSHAAGGEGMLQLGHVVDGEAVVDEAILTWRGPQEAEIGIHGGPAVTARVLDLLGRLGATVPPPSPAAAAADAAVGFPTAYPQLGNPAVGAELLATLPLAHSTWVVAILSRQWSGGVSGLVRQAIGQLGDSCGAGILPALQDASRMPAPQAESCTPPSCGDQVCSVPVRAFRKKRLTASLRTPERLTASLQTPALLRRAGERLALIRRLLEPAEVVLAGPPNVGKSTLANALIGRQVSLVHDQAGTTRDWVRDLAILHGVPVHVTDTAGLWDAAAGVDAQAVDRARQRIEQADVVLLLGAGRQSPPPAWLAECHKSRPPTRILHVATKIDVLPAFGGADAAVCAVTGDGLEALGRRIVEALGLGPSDLDPAAPAAFTQRQADLLGRAAAAIETGRIEEARQCLGAVLEG
jgi:tRNA modification GTPase